MRAEKTWEPLGREEGSTGASSARRSLHPLSYLDQLTRQAHFGCGIDNVQTPVPVHSRLGAPAVCQHPAHVRRSKT